MKFHSLRSQYYGEVKLQIGKKRTSGAEMGYQRPLLLQTSVVKNIWRQRTLSCCVNTLLVSLTVHEVK